jgi:uncharacterized protein (TIGR03083 family)
MPPIDPDTFYAEISDSTGALAGLVSEADPALPVPSCPGWTIRSLATHVGRAQRWAAAITATRSAEFIEFRSVPDGKFPDDRAAQPEWLRAGAQRVIAAVQAAGSEPVWAFGTLQPASFWGAGWRTRPRCTGPTPKWRSAASLPSHRCWLPTR